MRELLIAPNPTLRSVCKPVENIDSEVKSLAQDLIDYMVAHREDEVAPFGLAAPQLGELIRVIAFYPNPSHRGQGSVGVLVNPELVKSRELIKVQETCLSLPRKVFVVERARVVKVRGLSLNGESRSYKARDQFAQVLQHELNHIDGVLIDKIGRRIKGK